MRDLVLIATLIAAFPLIFVRAHVGLLLWAWIAIMQPHREAFGVVVEMPINSLVAVATILSLLASPGQGRYRLNAMLIAILAFSVILGLSQAFSLRPDYSWAYFTRFEKVIAFAVIAHIVLHNRRSILAAIGVMVTSLAYFMIAGGAFTIITGGQHHVLGPRASQIADNNHVGLAIASALPLVSIFWSRSYPKVIRLGAIGTFLLGCVAVIGTQSRGAVITLGVMALLFTVQARRFALMWTILIGFGIGAAVTFMPQAWQERIATIEEFEADASFQGRVDAWRIATAIAIERPLTGAGPRVPYLDDVARRFVNDPVDARAAHSMYFEVLGSTGFLGLGAIVFILAAAIQYTRRAERLAQSASDLAWARDTARRLRISLITFAVGSAALSVEMWEGFWLMVILSGALVHVCEQHGAPKAATINPGRLASSEVQQA